MIALDDAAWGSPWRQRAVGEKLLLSMGLLATAVTAPPWPMAAPLVAAAAVFATLVLARIPPRVLAMQLPDMNLLVALDALLDEGSVVGAARRMNLSPAAMSRTLTRIR